MMSCIEHSQFFGQQPWRPNQFSFLFLVSFEFSFDIILNIEIETQIGLAVPLGFFSLATKVEGKKVPGFIKKFNKFLGLPSKSEKILDILKISGNEEKINNIEGNVQKNIADIWWAVWIGSKYFAQFEKFANRQKL